MGAKTIALPFEIAFETVVIETCFANRHNFGVPGKANQRVFIRFLALLCIGMDPYCRIQIGKTLGQTQHPRKALQGHAGNQSPTDLVGFHGGQKICFPPLKIWEIEMAV